MPYKSEAQRRYFNANREKLEAQGVDVDEWNESSKGMELPERADSGENDELSPEKKKSGKKSAGADFPALYKSAVEFIVGPHPKKKLEDVSGLGEVIDAPQHRRRPTPEDLKRLKRIAEYMTASKPHQLTDTVVLSGKVPDSGAVLWARALTSKSTPNLPGDKRRRRLLANDTYLHIDPKATAEQQPSYHIIPDVVFLNHNSPASLIHELGHAVDLKPGEREWRLRTALRQRLATSRPTLSGSEFRAWRKGRKAYQEGYAASPEANDPKSDHQEYQEAMEAYNRAKYPAFGAYLGAGLGGTFGALAGLGLARKMGIIGSIRERRSPMHSLARVLIPLIGSTIGGAFGHVAGGYAGGYWAEKRKEKNKEKAMQQLRELQQNPERLAAVRKRLLQMRDDEQALRKFLQKAASLRLNRSLPAGAVSVR